MNPSTAQTPMKTRAAWGHGGGTIWARVRKTRSRKLSSWESRAELPDTLEQERREKSGGLQVDRMRSTGVARPRGTVRGGACRGGPAGPQQDWEGLGGGGSHEAKHAWPEQVRQTTVTRSGALALV